MKKGRPGIMVSVFTKKERLQDIINYLIENTTTIGVRSYPAGRQALERTSRTITTSMGTVDVKEMVLPSGKKRTTIEFESCKKIAKEHNLPVPEMFSILSKEI